MALALPWFYEGGALTPQKLSLEYIMQHYQLFWCVPFDMESRNFWVPSQKFMCLYVQILHNALLSTVIANNFQRLQSLLSDLNLLLYWNAVNWGVTSFPAATSDFQGRWYAPFVHNTKGAGREVKKMLLYLRIWPFHFTDVNTGLHLAWWCNLFHVVLFRLFPLWRFLSHVMNPACSNVPVFVYNTSWNNVVAACSEQLCLFCIYRPRAM